VARRAVGRGTLVTGTERVGGDTLAEAAMPVPYAARIARIVLFSVSVSSVAHNVSTVRHEILVAGGIALLLALIGSYVLARALALRVKRLERAARRMAAGDFSAPIPPGGSDELGQLARAFNDMQRQLRQLDEARKRFIATASHELRTPIFSLGGFVELLEDEDLDPETRRRFLEQVRDQVERLRKLSVDLLDLSRLESGSLELRPEGVDLAELARSVSGEFEPTLAAQDGHLELRLQSRRVEAFCDPVRVAQILRILLDNALTHTGEGTHVTVTAGRHDGHVRLAVRDDGEGVAPDAAPRIFEPFYTAHGTRGSGLGLAIASELAERMAAELRVRSRPGETVFTLELPG
jgi:signal transduction histidine kinase